MPKDHILFVGNPGVGKSTMVNALLGKEAFKSGFNPGSGLTTCLQKVEHGGITYMDTPGLEDTQMREQAGKEITKALKMDGNYKVFFVVTLEAGRVRPQDSTTMKIVLDAAPITEYAIIINKMSPGAFKKINKPAEGGEPSNLDLLRASMFKGIKPTIWVHHALEDETLKDEDSAEIDWSKIQLSPLLVDFITQKVPGMHIAKEAVQDIKVDQYDSIVAAMEEQMAQFRKSIDALQQANAKKDAELAAQQSKHTEVLMQMLKESKQQPQHMQMPSPSMPMPVPMCTVM